MYLPRYSHSLSRVFLYDPKWGVRKKYSSIQKFVKYNPKNSAPCHSELLPCLKTLTCKWRLNCAVEPNSLQTDARHHGTFKGQGKKTRNSKKGTKPTPPQSKQAICTWQKRPGENTNTATIRLIFDVIYDLRLFSDSKNNLIFYVFKRLPSYSGAESRPDV